MVSKLIWEERSKGVELLPEEPLSGSMSGDTETADWAVHWLADGGEVISESYVNLVPTIQGGTHVNGLRLGLLEAVRRIL